MPTSRYYCHRYKRVYSLLLFNVTVSDESSFYIHMW